MGEPALSWALESEVALVRAAGAVASRWRRAGLDKLLVGLQGDLGTGKTTWVRGMLRGLGYAARVPSPTYTLAEVYDVDSLRVVHLDLYRLARAAELENLGVRDWLSEPGIWMLVEWPERAPTLQQHCDVAMRFEVSGAGRRVSLTALGDVGTVALGTVAADAESDSSYTA